MKPHPVDVSPGRPLETGNRPQLQPAPHSTSMRTDAGGAPVKFATFFIDRPIFAAVLSIVL